MDAGQFYIIGGGGYDFPVWLDIIIWTVAIGLCVVFPIVALIIGIKNNKKTWKNKN